MLSQLKWFASGKERGERAVELIDNLIDDLKAASENDKLVKVFADYREEFKKKETAIPHILMRLNLDMSKVMRSEGVILSDKQSEKVKELMSLSHIKYGY